MKEQTEQTQGNTSWRDCRLSELGPECLSKAQCRGKALSYLFWIPLWLMLALCVCKGVWFIIIFPYEKCTGLEGALFWTSTPQSLTLPICYIKQLGFNLGRILLHSHLLEKYIQFSLSGHTETNLHYESTRNSCYQWLKKSQPIVLSRLGQFGKHPSSLEL